MIASDGRGTGAGPPLRIDVESYEPDKRADFRYYTRDGRKTLLGLTLLRQPG
jgi:hypothetical protein